MIRVADDTGVRRIMLARPDKRNALTPDMLHEIAQAARSEARTRAVLITGEGKAFSAGFDLRARPGDLSYLRAQLEALSAAMIALRRCAAPVLIGVHGAAIAGGCALLSAADLVVVEADAQLGYPALRLGLSPAVSAPFVRAGASGGATRGLQLAQRLVSGREAVAIGVAHEAIDGDEPTLARASAIASEIARKLPGAMQRTKAWLLELEPVLASDADAALATSVGAITDETLALMQREVWSR